MMGSIYNLRMPNPGSLALTAPTGLTNLPQTRGLDWSSEARRDVIEWLGEPPQRLTLKHAAIQFLPRLADLAEDVVSAYLTELLEHPARLARFRPDKGSFAHFILNDLIGFARANPLFRERSRSRARTEDLDREREYRLAPPSSVYTPEFDSERVSPKRQLRAVARLSRNELSDREYDVIALQIDGQKPEEIARLLGATVSSVTSSARRAISKIRQVFELYSHKNKALVGQPLGDVVECSVFGPRATAPGSQAFLQVFVHTPHASEEAL